MKDDHKKYLTFFCVIAAVAVAGILGLDYLKNVRDSSVYATQIGQIKEASGVKDIKDFHKRTDKLREFINKNSQHKEDEEFFALWRDKTKMAGAFLDHLEGRRKTLPHMECSTRAELMAAILESEGYRTRSVDAFHVGGAGSLNGHALLDVFNPETHKWETQDPEYNVYWKNVKTGERSTMVQSVADLKAIQPCNSKACGFNLPTREDGNTMALKALREYVSTIDTMHKERITFYRADIDPKKQLKTDKKQGTYCDIRKKNCADGFLPATKENIERILD